MTDHDKNDSQGQYGLPVQLPDTPAPKPPPRQNTIEKIKNLLAADTNQKLRKKTFHNTPLDKLTTHFNHNSQINPLAQQDHIRKLIKEKSRYLGTPPPLFQAVASGSIPDVEQALANGQNINTTFELGGNALHIAVDNNDLPMCRFLVGKGISLTEKRPLTGYTPLHEAMAKGYDRIAVFLSISGSELTPPKGKLLPLSSPQAFLQKHSRDHGNQQAADPFSPERFNRLRAQVSAYQARTAKRVRAPRKRSGKAGSP